MITLPNGAWFDLRPSNTEPLLRLNVEGPDRTSMTQFRHEILNLPRAPIPATSAVK